MNVHRPGRIAALHGRVGRSSPVTVGLLGLAGLLLVAAADYLTGSELSSSVFYVAPIALAAAYGHRRWALALALSGAGLWYLADFLVGLRYSQTWIGVWNAGVRLTFFVLIAELLLRLQTALEVQRRLAGTDLRTGLANARRFMEAVNVEVARADRYGHPVTLAYLDLDGFKSVNDRLGHREGDRVLEEMGRCLRTHVRATDVPARLGGDEFAVLFPETDRVRAREAVANLRDALDVSVASRWPVGVSMGVITRTARKGDGNALIHAADDLMYRVKRSEKGSVRFGEL